MESEPAVPEMLLLAEGPAHFLDLVYETIEAHLTRAGDPYEQIITGIGAEDVGDVDHEESAILHLYVPETVPTDEAMELVDRALDRIADEHNMEQARHGVEITFEDPARQEEL